MSSLKYDRKLLAHIMLTTYAISSSIAYCLCAAAFALMAFEAEPEPELDIDLLYNYTVSDMIQTHLTIYIIFDTKES